MEVKLIISGNIEDMVFPESKNFKACKSKTITIKGGPENLNLDLPKDIQDELIKAYYPQDKD